MKSSKTMKMAWLKVVFHMCAYLSHAPFIFFRHCPFSLSNCLTSPGMLAGVWTPLLGKGNWEGRENICTCARLHKLGVKGAQVKLFDRKTGQTKKSRWMNFHLIFCEDRYAGKDGIRASPVESLASIRLFILNSWYAEHKRCPSSVWCECRVTRIVTSCL